MIFEIRPHDHGCVDTFNFLFRNVQPSYFQKMIFKHRRKRWFRRISNYIVFEIENQGQKSKTYELRGFNSCSNRPCRCYYSTGVTTLRVMWNERGRAARHWNRASEPISWFLRPQPPANVSFPEIFMIFENRPHHDGCVVPYNFFVSQRQAVILSENDIQTPADRTY